MTSMAPVVCFAPEVVRVVHRRLWLAVSVGAMVDTVGSKRLGN
jgi:hypothetical protein